MRQIRKFYNKISLTWKIAIILVVFIIGIFVIHYRTPQDFQWSDYACNIATELFGILVTIIFVENLFNRYNKSKAKQEELEKIVRMHNIAFIYMKFYLRQLHCITTPIEERFKGDIKLEKDFSLQDLQYIYTPTLILTESYQQSSIECFF